MADRASLFHRKRGIRVKYSTFFLNIAVIQRKILPDDALYRFIQIRFQLLDGFGLIVENRIIARSADELDDHIDHDLWIIEMQPGFFQ